MDFVQGMNRNQLYFTTLSSYVEDDSWARIVDWFVDAFDLEELGFVDVLNLQGRPPYHSSDLLKLYLYGYKNKIKSSRALHKACKINMEVMWLLKGLKPSARTIAYFRKNNDKPIEQTMRKFVNILKEWELIDGQTIAIDSFKIRAQNSLKNNYNQKKIDRHVKYIDDKINEYNKLLDDNDKLDNDQKEILEDKINHNKNKKQKYKNLEKQLNESGEAQISTTDPDARSVVLHRNIVNVGYNIQAATDSKYKLFCCPAQTGTVNDTHALSPMAIDAKQLLGVSKMNTLTDKGYTTGEQINICSKNNITTYSSPKAHSSNNNGLFSKNQFRYDKENDTYICPNDEVLTTNANYYKKASYKVKHYKTKKCKECPIKAQCTTNKRGRLIERSIYQEALEQNEQRVNSNPEYYRQRQQIIEHQFGTLKRQWDFTYTLMKGKKHVLSEVNLMQICYNLCRSVSILGLNELKLRLKALVYHFLHLRAVFPSLTTKYFLKYTILHSALLTFFY